MLQRFFDHTRLHARRRLERAALALRPARPAGTALELSAGDRAVAAPLRSRWDARKSPGGGARLAPACRTDARRTKAAGQRGRRGGPRPPPRASLCLPLGRELSERPVLVGPALRERG